MRSELNYAMPPLEAVEVLVKAGNFDKGMDRIWVQLPTISSRSDVYESLCSCSLEELEVGVYPSLAPAEVRVAMAMLKVCAVKVDHKPRNCILTPYFIGQCRRCKTIYWALAK